MNRTDLVLRSRSLVRDLTNSFFREIDLVNYLNEGIDRMVQVIPELKDTPYLKDHLQEVTHIPREYQHLLAVYCAARLLSQDERHYQAGTFMNEFETKLINLYDAINNGDVEIIDPLTGEAISFWKEPEYVTNRYFSNKQGVVPTSGDPNKPKNTEFWGD